MKRLLIPMILIVLFTGIIFVSCSKKEEAPATTVETEAKTEEGKTGGTTTTTRGAWEAPTFKTVATTSTEKGGTRVKWATTTTTTKATTTTAAPTTAAPTTTTGKHTAKPTTTTTKPSTSTDSPVIPPQGPEYNDEGKVVFPAQPVGASDKFGQMDLLGLITKVLG